MSNGSGISRGDRNRNARLSRLRELVPVSNAIVGIDLADNKQMVVVTDHDSKVLARRTFRCRAWCYVPEPVDETWGRLRHLGARREQLIAESTSQVQQMRDLLECVGRQPWTPPSNHFGPAPGLRR